MATVKIKLANDEIFREVIFRPDVEFVKQNLHNYDVVYQHQDMKHVGESACDEMFDLTNNPRRDDERAMTYGRGRSVSVGDIVEVDGINYLCNSFGWTELSS